MKATYLAAALTILANSVNLPAQTQPAVLEIDPAKVQREFHPERYLGSNVAVWESPATYSDSRMPATSKGPFQFSMIRLPGGSYSDITYWNGHGVRDKKTGKVDLTRMKDGYPDIDYSDYAPTVLVDGRTRELRKGDWHGNVDVRVLHEFAKGHAREQFVCVNGGTGRPVDAAEWVRWANKKMGYGIRYWEVGQELDGGWEGGHFAPDGTELTAAMYAARFKAFATEMKKVDPNIRVGGPGTGVVDGGFIETLLRDAGDQVDFITVHTYPGNALFTDEQQFERALKPSEEIGNVRKWIRQYQPAREKQIEVAYSEWNLPAARVLWDLDGALWSVLFMREMARNGVDFAIQWDVFGKGMGLFHGDDGRRTPGSQFWAYQMWRDYVGPQMLSSGRVANVEYLATRDESSVYVLMVNTSRKEDATIQMKVAGARTGSVHRLTYAQFFWDPFTGRPETSAGPQSSAMQGSKVSVPPFSVVAVAMPLAAGERGIQPAAPPAKTTSLKLLTADAVYAGEETEIWVRAMDGDKPAENPAMPVARISAEGVSVQPGSAEARIAESAGRVMLRPMAAGDLTLRATAGPLSTSRTLAVRPSLPKPLVIWDAEEDELSAENGYEGDWPIVKDTTARANVPVMRVDLKDATTDKRPYVVKLVKFPPTLNRSAVRGAVFDIKLSPDFRCEDPNAKLRVIMQSEADWWMELGEVKLAPGELADWKHVEVLATQEKHIKAMPHLLNMMLVLLSSRPVNGSVYVDQAGLMVR